MERIPSLALGKGECEACGAPVDIKTDVNGSPYYACPGKNQTEGCQRLVQTGPRKGPLGAAGHHLVKRIKKWNDGAKEKLGLRDAAPAPSPAPAAHPKPPSSPGPSKKPPAPKSPPPRAETAKGRGVLDDLTEWLKT